MIRQGQNRLMQEALVTWSKKSLILFMRHNQVIYLVFIDFRFWTWWCLVSLSKTSGKLYSYMFQIFEVIVAINNKKRLEKSTTFVAKLGFQDDLILSTTIWNFSAYSHLYFLMKPQSIYTVSNWAVLDLNRLIRVSLSGRVYKFIKVYHLAKMKKKSRSIDTDFFKWVCF